MCAVYSAVRALLGSPESYSTFMVESFSRVFFDTCRHTAENDLMRSTTERGVPKIRWPHITDTRPPPRKNIPQLQLPSMAHQRSNRLFRRLVACVCHARVELVSGVIAMKHPYEDLFRCLNHPVRVVVLAVVGLSLAGSGVMGKSETRAAIQSAEH